MLRFNRIFIVMLLSAAAVFAGSFAGGSGTVADPYQIATADQFKAFAALVNSGKTSVSGILTKDIALNDTSNYDDWGADNPDNVWSPIGSATSPYQGVFDGNNHYVDGLFIDTTLTVSLAGGFADSSIGLFAQIGASGTVRNIKMRDAYVSISVVTDTAGVTDLNEMLFRTGVNGGIAVGKNSGIVKNITLISGKFHGVSGQFFRAGAIAGRNDGLLYNCVNYAEVYIRRNGNVWVDVGGIVGNDAGDVGDCLNYGNITSENTVGGIAGLLTKEGRLFNCANYGIITSTNSLLAYVGGIVGKANSGLIDCVYNLGAVAVEAADNVIAGGIAGELGKDSSVVLKNAYSAAEAISITNSSKIAVGAAVGNVETSKVEVDSVYAKESDSLSLFGTVKSGTSVGDTAELTAAEMQSQEFAKLLGDAFTYEKGYPSLKMTSVSALMFVVDGTVADVDEVTDGAKYALPNLAVSGYKILYWALDGDSVGVAGDTVSVTGDMVFFAKAEVVAGIAPVTRSARPLSYRVENLGLVFESLKTGTRVAVFDLRGRAVADFVAQSSEARVNLPAPGIYSVRTGTSASLVSVK